MAKLEKGNYFTEERWEKVNDENKEWLEEFLAGKINLKESTYKQYQNSLQIFFIWNSINRRNKPLTDLKVRDITAYLGWLLNQGLSAGSVKFKKNSLSSLCEFVISEYYDEYPNFRNIARMTEDIKGAEVHKKEVLSLEEINKLRKYLKENEYWQELAYLDLSYSTGARRNEVRHIKKEVVNHELTEGGFYYTNEVPVKGEKGSMGKLAFSKDAMKSIKKWLEVRGEDDCEYLFVSKNKKGEARQISLSTPNSWCRRIFSKVLEKRVHPHMFRRTRATHIVVEEKKDILTAKDLLGHKSSETTEIYVLRDKTDSLKQCF